MRTRREGAWRERRANLVVVDAEEELGQVAALDGREDLEEKLRLPLEVLRRVARSGEGACV